MKATTETPRDEFAALCRQAWDTLIPARASYLADVSPHYDDVLHDVAQRTEHTGSLGKADIAALVVWKRLSAQTRWVTALMSLPDTHIRAVTEQAVTAARDTPGLPLHPHTGTLRPLPPTPRRPPPTRLSTHRRLECTRHRHHPVLDRRQPAPAGTGIGPPAQALTTQQAADQHKPAPAL
ncbi:hypothetical protein [Streptomyces sp. MUSC 14]|uniref:hypothetical protein n=1 Tax=Streptomyces sp. MUSC 14 TaxID=1354889 RepID=UPI000AB3D852|nr:hypothetical protein [Streptomyces sp. MUSC 14]